MELKNLNTFVQVAESGSFSRAAERLGYSQPTISVQIRQLEDELGLRLFDRIGHAIRLTDKGHDILPHAQKILHTCQEMTLQTQKESAVPTVIRLAMADSLCRPLLSRGFAQLQEQFPNIRLELTTAGTGDLFQLLDRNEVDLVCTLDTHVYNTNYMIAAEEQIGVHLAVSADHPLAGRGTVTRQDLLGQRFLLTEHGMSYRRLLDEWMAQASLEIKPVLEAGSADLLCDLVEAGAGISFLPDYVTCQAAQRGRVVLLDIADFSPQLWKQFLYHRDKWVSRPMEAVIRHLAAIPLGKFVHFAN